MKFRVGASGKPENVVTFAPGLADQELLKKVAARLTVVTFVPPKDAEYEVSYTFRFTQHEP